MFDVVGKKRWFFLFSGLITVPGLIFIFLTPLTDGRQGLQFSIDYTGGTLWEVRFADESVTPAAAREVLAEQGLEDSSVVSTSEGYLLIRTKAIGLEPPAPSPTPVATLEASPAASPSPAASASASPAASASPSPAASASPVASSSPAASPAPSASPAPAPSASPGAGQIPTSGKLGEVAMALQDEFGPIESQRSLTTIGAVVSSDLVNQAILLIIVGSLGILLWISFRFHEVKFGATALIALLHDVIVVVGTFAVLGTLFGIEINALFVTAMLTIIGFSVHDTIVVFDRIRENKARHAGEPFAAIVNHSILQTFGRSINTSMTVVLTLLALLLFIQSAEVRPFVLALLIGIVSGTYSSIFNASQLLVVWEEWEARRRGRLVAAGRSSRRVSA